MLIFNKSKIVYLANPKSGTTSIMAAFRTHADFCSVHSSPAKHINYETFTTRFPFHAENFEMIAVVREPLETLFSWYRYRQRPELEGNLRSTLGIDFDDFVRDWSENPSSIHAKISPSTKFVCDKNGKLGGVKIFKYSTHNPLHKYLEAKLGVEVIEQRKNVSPQHSHPFDEAVQTVDRDLPRLKSVYELYNSIRFCDET